MASTDRLTRAADPVLIECLVVGAEELGLLVCGELIENAVDSVAILGRKIDDAISAAEANELHLKGDVPLDLVPEENTIAIPKRGVLVDDVLVDRNVALDEILIGLTHQMAESSTVLKSEFPDFLPELDKLNSNHCAPVLFV